MGRRLSFCEFDGELISLRPYGYFLEQKSHNDIPFIALDQNPDISKLSQGAELAKAEAWGTSCIICGPTVTWFQTYVIYFKRLMFERLEHKDDYDLVYFSADEIYQKNGVLMEDVPYDGNMKFSYSSPTFKPENQKRMSWQEKDSWFKLSKDGKWEQIDAIHQISGT